MGRNSNGNRDGGLLPGDFSYKGEMSGIESIVHIKDPKVYKATKNAIARYHAVLGVREREIKLANMPGGIAGAHATVNGKSKAIYLNKEIFNKPYKTVEAIKKRGYEVGWATRTNKPIAHTVTHELAHATWNTKLSGANKRAAGKEIRALYKTWYKDKGKRGYGKYARTNVNEFFAETTTRAVHGKSDKYTNAIKDIIKKYKL